MGRHSVRKIGARRAVMVHLPGQRRCWGPAREQPTQTKNRTSNSSLRTSTAHIDATRMILAPCRPTGCMFEKLSRKNEC